MGGYITITVGTAGDRGDGVDVTLSQSTLTQTLGLPGRQQVLKKEALLPPTPTYSGTEYDHEPEVLLGKR